MKPSTLLTSVSVVVALALGAAQLGFGPAQPEKTKEKAPEAQPDPNAMMEEMMKLGKPGKEHEMLARMVGTWDCTTRFYEPGPDGQMAETVGKGEAKFTSELGGRWIRQDFKSEFGGEPFQGFGYTGYDNAKGEYFGTWADNMSTSMMTMTGTYAEASKTMTLVGSFNMPGMGDVKTRYTTVEKDADTVIFTMYHVMGGQESKAGEITYKRRK